MFDQCVPDLPDITVAGMRFPPPARASISRNVPECFKILRCKGPVDGDVARWLPRPNRTLYWGASLIFPPILKVHSAKYRRNVSYIAGILPQCALISAGMIFCCYFWNVVTFASHSLYSLLRKAAISIRQLHWTGRPAGGLAGALATASSESAGGPRGSQGGGGHGVLLLWVG